MLGVAQCRTLAHVLFVEAQKMQPEKRQGEFSLPFKTAATFRKTARVGRKAYMKVSYSTSETWNL